MTTSDEISKDGEPEALRHRSSTGGDTMMIVPVRGIDSRQMNPPVPLMGAGY